jgi:hypothetical protein
MAFGIVSVQSHTQQHTKWPFVVERVAASQGSYARCTISYDVLLTLRETVVPSIHIRLNASRSHVPPFLTARARFGVMPTVHYDSLVDCIYEDAESLPFTSYFDAKTDSESGPMPPRLVLFGLSMELAFLAFWVSAPPDHESNS